MKCLYFLIILKIGSAFTITQHFSNGIYRTSTTLFVDSGVEIRTTQTSAEAVEDRRARLESELAAMEEKTKYLMSKSESLKIELEDKKKADEEAAAEAKKKADEEAAAEAKKKADEEAVLEAKKKADKEAFAEAKKKADEEAFAEAKKKADKEAAAEAKSRADEEAVLEAKKKADEEAFAEAKKKADEEAAAEAKKKNDEEAAAEAKKQADEEAAAEAKKQADEKASAGLDSNTKLDKQGDKRVITGENDGSRLREVAQKYNTSKKSIQKPNMKPSVERVTSIRPLKETLGALFKDPTQLNFETFKQELSSNNEVRLVTGSATIFSGLIFFRSFLVQRPENQNEKRKASVISQAMERVGAGEISKPQPKPYTKVPTTKKINITAEEQSAAKPKAEASKTKPVKPKDLSKSKPKVPTKNTSDIEAEKPIKLTDEVAAEIPPKILETLSEKEVQGMNDSSNAQSAANSSAKESIPDKSMKSKPSRPFLGGASSYLDSL